MKRIELIVCFDSMEDAQTFIDQHISRFSDEPPIAKEVTAYGMYDVDLPDSNVGMAHVSLRQSYVRDEEGILQKRKEGE